MLNRGSIELRMSVNECEKVHKKTNPYTVDFAGTVFFLSYFLIKMKKNGIIIMNKIYAISSVVQDNLIWVIGQIL